MRPPNGVAAPSAYSSPAPTVGVARTEGDERSVEKDKARFARRRPPMSRRLPLPLPLPRLRLRREDPRTCCARCSAALAIEVEGRDRVLKASRVSPCRSGAWLNSVDGSDSRPLGVRGAKGESDRGDDAGNAHDCRGEGARCSDDRGIQWGLVSAASSTPSPRRGASPGENA